MGRAGSSAKMLRASHRSIPETAASPARRCHRGNVPARSSPGHGQATRMGSERVFHGGVEGLAGLRARDGAGSKEASAEANYPTPGGHQRSRMLQPLRATSPAPPVPPREIFSTLLFCCRVLFLLSQQGTEEFSRVLPQFTCPSATANSLPRGALVRLRSRKSTKRRFRSGFESSRSRARPKASRDEGNVTS